ncbi:MAG: hypothetical protein OEW37_08690 [Rhodospirillaceae bacterium]|nr:hypothetical protein [Rhodospirillaceae bacterium]
MSINWQIIEDIISAEKLRRYANIAKAKSEAKLNANASAGESALEEHKRIFIQSEFLERDSESLKQKILDAARQGKYEVEVIRFPGAYCIDGGRAINNLEKNWPESLQGKAKSFYIIWKEHGHPHGYRLKARINSYPDGFIGDVSILVDWS